LNEKKLVTKRAYTESHPAKTVGMTAKIRNKMLEAIKDGKVATGEFDRILKELSSNSKRWMNRNGKLFNVSEEGISLSTLGKRILKGITVNEATTENPEVWVPSGFDKAISKLPNSQVTLDVVKKLAKKHKVFIEDAIKYVEYGWALDLQENKNTQIMKTKLVKESFQEFISANEATVVMDATQPDDKAFLKFLKKNKVSIEVIDQEGPSGFPEVELTGKREDLEKVLASPDGWDDADLAEYIEESVVNEAKELFQLDIDSDEHGALGLSVTMKELKDVYKKNKKDINDVEDLLLKFVYAQPEDFAANDAEGMEISGANAGDVQTMLAKEFGIKESLVNEAFKSSKLRNLLTMTDSMTYGDKADAALPKAFYQLTKMKLDQIGDEDLIDMTPKEAYKAYANDRDTVVFYIVDNDKANPFGTGQVAPGVLALTRGKDFLGVQYESTGYRRKKNTKTLKGGDDRMAVGGNKAYKGYDATGIASIKRAADLADRAVAFSLVNTAKSSKEDIAMRVDQKSGATAFMNDKDFKDANKARYKEILATKASKLPLDKMVNDAIDDLSSQIKNGLAKGEKGRYGDILIGRTSKDREVKMRDASNHMSSILDDYSRYVDYTKQAEEAKAEKYSSSYYEKEVKNYAKEIKDKCAKIKKFDYAW
jgi:hypothetical protein